jgi:mannose-6-phosphate isomerase-like protein (cupin superfamily)
MQTASEHLDALEWKHWPLDQIAIRGKAQWKELLGSASGCQNDITMGVVRLRQDESLEPHRHSQPETYYTLSGRGTVTIEGVVHDVEPGRMLFIPSNAQHQINNVNEEDLQILYVFAVSDFSKIQYHF